MRWRRHIEINHKTNANDIHEQSMSLDERIGLVITSRVGTLGFFVILAIWIVVWVFWNAGPFPHFDPGPAFVILLLGSNFIQLLLMPLIMVGQNVQARHQEIQADVDHQTLLYLRQINEQQLEILHALRGLPHVDQETAPTTGATAG